MKLTLLSLSLLLFTQTSHAAFLQYKISTQDSGGKSVTKYYIAGPYQAQFRQDGSGHIINYKTDKVIQFEDKEYYVTSLKKSMEQMLKLGQSMKTMNAGKDASISQKQKFKKLKQGKF